MKMRFNSHLFDVRHDIPNSKTPNIQIGKPAKALLGVVLLFAIGIGIYSLNSKTGGQEPLAKTAVAHVRPAWH